ncbi:MAG: hypothetical protein L0H79_11685 [Intrasporangium sp.]|uniref:hypothetical protein n=1 Tax=Intrasporangium sp. TaxID=1925024 RepID=UPI0026480BB2|nr:hypothetical protein [Intrasporangium sp.]MDN5796397.1 hypothetical protein [Intrasporangium sp.]
MTAPCCPTLARVVGLSGLALLLVSGCGAGTTGGADHSGESTGSPTPATTTSATATSPDTSTQPRPLPTGLPGVALDAALTSDHSRLVARYRVTNSSQRPVVVVDRIPKSLGSATLGSESRGDIDPTFAWVVMADGVLRVTKQAFPIAPGVRFVAPPVIGGHVAEPGGSISGTAEAPLPARLTVPGREFEAPREPIDPAATQWQFCVQVAGLEPPRDVIPVSAVADAPLLCTAPESLPS